jgi:ribosomal protein S12 methylthiotransferase accessory factor
MLELLDSPATPVADALDRLEQAVSPLVGIVRVAPAIMVAADEARLHAFACQVASAARTTGSATVEYAGSAHVRSERARAASIGEAVERYSATFVPEGLTTASTGELGADAVPPESYALFHERQHVPGFPFTRFTQSTRLSFVEGFALDDGRPAFLPAQLVYLHYGRSEPPIGYPTSNGLACGPTLAEAVLAALLEVVERDAMMLVWANRLSLPRLTWLQDPAIRAVDSVAFAPTGLRYTAIDASAFFGVPAAIGVVRGSDGDRAAIGIGGRLEDVRRGGIRRPPLAARPARRLAHAARASRGRSDARRSHAVPRNARAGGRAGVPRGLRERAQHNERPRPAR